MMGQIIRNLKVGNMDLKYYFILIGSVAIVPLFCHLIWGHEKFIEKVHRKVDLAKIIFLSFFIFELFWIIIKIYLMVSQLPLTEKW